MADFDPGAVNSTYKVRECDGNLAVSLMLKKLLETNGIAVLMSRTTDVACGGAKDSINDISNQIAFANKSMADLAVSIHFNSSANKTATGTEVLYSTALYNDPKRKRIADLLLRELVLTTKLPNRGLKTPDNVSVVKKIRIPVALTECAFVSNNTEYKWCSDATLQMELARAHAKAICKYFGITYKEEEELTEVKVIVNGKEVSEGYLIAGTSYVPVRAIAEALGAKVTWDAATNTVIIKK